MVSGKKSCKAKDVKFHMSAQSKVIRN